MNSKLEKMSRRVRISNESLNSYGTRVLTAGMNVDQYNRNPVLLYMHERGQVIGYVKDLKVEGDEVTGELMFDEATELSQRCKKQWEFGSLKMVSAGIDILELSEDPKHLVQGQTRPTISKSKLFEVSVVDIGANDDAIVLQKDGKRIELGKDGGVELPLLHSNNQNQTPKQMDQEKLALQLGLPKDADEATITAKLAKLQADGAEAETLRQERDTLRAARIETLVNAAIAEKKIGEEKKQQFLDLGKKIGAEELKQTFDAMSPQVKLSRLVGYAGADGHTLGGPDWKKLSDVPVDELEKLRAENPAQYKKLYKAGILVAVLVNCIVGGTLSSAAGVPAVYGAAGLNVCALVFGRLVTAGNLGAGVYTEIWTGEMVKHLRRGLEGSWLDGIPDSSSIVKNDVIHLVDVGVDPDVLINNTTYPIPLQALDDQDIAISLDKFQTKVTPVTDDELYAISYDKMSRVKESHGNSIADSKFAKAAHSFCAQKNTAKTPVLKTTGSREAETGRVKLCMQDIINLKKALDKLGVPTQGRRLVL